MRKFFIFIALFNVFALGQAVSPEDVTGLYSFVRSGETVQVNVQPGGRVTGYVSHMAEGESDRGQMLDLIFDRASLQDSHLEFHTRKIHGEFFEFKGRVERGNAKSRDEEGYVVIRGTLTTVTEDVSGKPTSIARDVEFRSFPGGM